MLLKDKSSKAEPGSEPQQYIEVGGWEGGGERICEHYVLIFCMCDWIS